MEEPQMNMENQADQMNTPIAPQESTHSKGALIGSIIIVTILVIGGIYFYMEEKENAAMKQAEQAQAESLKAIDQQGTSDDLSSIEADFKATDTTNLDQDL